MAGKAAIRKQTGLLPAECPRNGQDAGSEGGSSNGKVTQMFASSTNT